jgi:hypothetical protein
MLKKSMCLALAGALVALTGCAVSPTELRNKGPEFHSSFVVQQNYQPAYRTVLENQRDCGQQNLITASFQVQGDIFHEIRSGTITTALHGALGVQTTSVIDLKAVDDQSTEIIVTSSSKQAQAHASLIRKWLKGERGCDI